MKIKLENSNKVLFLDIKNGQCSLQFANNVFTLPLSFNKLFAKFLNISTANFRNLAITTDAF